MARVPNLGESPYKTILDGYLAVSHNTDGTPKLSAFQAAFSGQLLATSVVIGTASGSTVGVNVLSSATGAAAIVGQATGYYAGQFFNVTDAGSDLANANQVGLVAQSAYSNAFYAQQGAISGTGSTLARNNIYPALYATRVVGSLNGFDYTAPVFRIDETTAATGGLMDAKKSTGATVFAMDKNGAIVATATSGVGLTIDRGIQLNAGVSATVAGPGIAVSSNVLRFTTGTGGLAFINQDNSASLGTIANTGAMTLTASAGTGLTVDRGIKLGTTNATATGPSFAISGNVLRISGGTSGLNFISQDQGTQTGEITNAGSWGVGTQAASPTTWLVTPAGTTGLSSLRIPHGAAPTSPVNGDMWTTTSGLFVRINGTTVGPLS
jgi:hypothetical protein